MAGILNFLSSRGLTAPGGKVATTTSEVNRTDENGSTPLVRAAAIGDTNVVEALLSDGGDCNLRNRFGETALTVAVSRGHYETAKRLLRQSRDLNYAFRKLIESDAPVLACEFLLSYLPPTVGEGYRQGRLALALTSREDCVAVMDKDPSCVGGVYQQRPDDLMLFSLARIPGCVGRLYVGQDVGSLDFMLRHAALLHDRELEILFLGDPESAKTIEPFAFTLREAPAPPAIVEIEPIDWCNLRCTMCHVSQMHDHKPSRLHPALLKDLGLEKARMVQLGAAFEPMLNKEFGEFVRACSDVPLSIATNATLLTPEIIDTLTTHGDVTLTVSIDGGSAETYESIRRLANFDDLRARLGQLVAARDRQTLTIGFSCTVMQSNLATLHEMIDFATEVDVESVHFRSVFVRDPSVMPESLDDMVADFANKLDEIGRRIITGGLRVTAVSPHFAFSRLREEFPDNVVGDTVFSAHPAAKIRVRQYPFLQLGKGYRALRCASPERLVRIDANGGVSLCKGFVIGNLADQRLDAIWNGPAASFVRQVVSEKPAICESCDHFQFCLNTGSRGSIESFSFSGPLKDKRSSIEANSDGSNPIARAFYGQLVDQRTEDLIKAARRDRADLATLVLSTGLDPDIADADGDLPITVAAESGALRVLDVLGRYGTSVNPTNPQLQPPLAAAAHSRLTEAVRLLIQFGADPAVATEWLCRRGDQEDAEWLRCTAMPQAVLN